MRTARADAWEGSRRLAGAFSGAAHSPQNFAAGAFSKPHLPHRCPNGAAHSLQNLSPSGLSVPHFEQRIGSPGAGIETSSITRRQEETRQGAASDVVMLSQLRSGSSNN